jgi:outer membrane lipoprotein-sorting protein
MIRVVIFILILILMLLPWSLSPLSALMAGRLVPVHGAIVAAGAKQSGAVVGVGNMAPTAAVVPVGAIAAAGDEGTGPANAGASVAGETLPVPGKAVPPDARTIVERAFDYLRGKNSRSVVEMTIHRPDFERRMVIRGWTRGRREALFFIDAPPRDAGNGTLKDGKNMWTYNPKIDRVIKLPPSMMSQGWMGSDFSNNDLAKSDTLLHDYVHRITGKKMVDDRVVYVVECMPRELAPVVWGKQELAIRADGLLLTQTFFDEDMVPVRELTTASIEVIDGKDFPREWTMRVAGETDRWTRLVYRELDFDVDLPGGLFTLSSLKRGGR